MLSETDNQRLTGVGRGTPMGDLLRRYWMPLAAVAELDDRPTKRVRLMSEDLVLYKDTSGGYGLLDAHCPHRRADMSYGIPDACGLRCSYHGWLFDRGGNCIEQPFEDVAALESPFKNKVKTKAYPVQAKAGLLWAYLGPSPAPELWDWDIYHANAYKQIIYYEVPCNWLQCQENSIDPIHFEWLHLNWSATQRGSTAASRRHVKLDFKEFEFGFTYHRLLENAPEDDALWTIGRVCLWPNCLFTAGFAWHVPVDDENTLTISFVIDDLPKTRPCVQPRVPYWYAPVLDARTGKLRTDTFGNQDVVAWVGQGRICDRTREHLGQSDRGILMLRRRLMQDLDNVAAGADPKGIVRDPARNHRIPLPRVQQKVVFGAAGPIGAFRPMPGQPQEIIDEMARLWAP